VENCDLFSKICIRLESMVRDIFSHIDRLIISRDRTSFPINDLQFLDVDIYFVFYYFDTYGWLRLCVCNA
jgi:hypothetical protein